MTNSVEVPLNFLSGPGKNAVLLTFLGQIGHRLEGLLGLCGARYGQKIAHYRSGGEKLGKFSIQSLKQLFSQIFTARPVIFLLCHSAHDVADML